MENSIMKVHVFVELKY